MTHALIYQDNKSAILLETNGKFLSSKRTKHIKMKYFFVKDKVDQGEVKIEHKPGEEMWVDMLSKPSQGIRFERDRSGLPNVPIQWPDETLSSAPLGPPMTKAAPQECVGDSAKNAKLSERSTDARRVTWARDLPTLAKRRRPVRRAPKPSNE
jgi:hypothetical protein